MEATVTSDKNKTSADKNMLILDSSSQDEAQAEVGRGCLLLSLNVDNKELPESLNEGLKETLSQKIKPNVDSLANSANHKSVRNSPESSHALLDNTSILFSK